MVLRTSSAEGLFSTPWGTFPMGENRKGLEAHEPGLAEGRDGSSSLTENSGLDSNDQNQGLHLGEHPLVLCVDDDPSILEALYGVLREALRDEALVEVVDSGSGAIEIVEEALEDGVEVAVIISDEIMPEMRGHRLLAQLASRVPDARAILLTGQASSEDIGAAVNSGILEGFIHKPWNNAELIVTVRAALARWRQAQELARTQKMTAFLLSGDPSAVMVVDSENQPVRWNPAADALVRRIPQGLDLTSLPGTVLESLQREAHQNPSGSGQRLTVGVMNGARFEQQAVYGPGPDGTWVYRLTDVTESIRTNQALERSLARDGERQRVEAIGMMTGSMIHDLNNYLFVISSITDILCEQDEENGQLAADLTMAVNQAQAMAKQMLSFVRNDPMEPELLEVVSAVKQAVSFGRRLESTDARIKLTAPTEQLWAEFATMHLQQVVLNLIKNALDAAKDAPARVEVSIVPGDPLVVRVHDHGPGIPLAVQRSLFKPFVTTKASGDGTGIGLTISRRLARLHGGDLRHVDSNGEGTTFELLLPAAVAPVERGIDNESPLTIGGHLLRKHRVLLLEDHRSARQLLERQLRELGAATVHSVGSVRDFSRWLMTNHEDPPDLVISDMMLPDGSWTEIVAAINAAHLSAPVLFVSGHSSQELVDLLPLDNPRAFLPKPFTRPVLGRALSVLLARAPAVREGENH